MSSTQSYISMIVQKFAFAIRTSAGHTFLVSRDKWFIFPT